MKILSARALLFVSFSLLAIGWMASADSGSSDMVCCPPFFSATAIAGEPRSGSSLPEPTPALPRLVDLGAGRCIPCKMMAPILDALKKEYEGKMEVVFVDVWQAPDAGKKYGIKIIPTQIFYDASGKELFRHEGFFAKEDILAKWKELGVDFTGKKQPLKI